MSVRICEEEYPITPLFPTVDTDSGLLLYLATRREGNYIYPRVYLQGRGRRRYVYICLHVTTRYCARSRPDQNICVDGFYCIRVDLDRFAERAKLSVRHGRLSERTIRNLVRRRFEAFIGEYVARHLQRAADWLNGYYPGLICTDFTYVALSVHAVQRFRSRIWHVLQCRCEPEPEFSDLPLRRHGVLPEVYNEVTRVEKLKAMNVGCRDQTNCAIYEWYV